MKSTEKQRAPQVRVLPEHVARKIAAGEVIDRPYATVRELLDNAIDSGASSIDLSLQGGGIDEVTVSDDGCGMDKDDLEVCWLPHATSKISSVEDLESARTLGFRGEALASIAACARLEILTSQGREGLRLSIQGGKSLGIEGHPAAPGTSVSMKDLFYNMPARRRFLKSAQAETRLCTRIFMEKAAAHPEVSFRLFREGKLKQFFPAGRHIDRVKAAWPRLAPEAAWWQTEVNGNGFQLIMVHARPESSRRDRQGIQIYANRRRIDEFALVQAVEHAYDAWMPGGAFPLAFIFLEIDPQLVDFNIHPAKKEARFRDIGAIRQRLIEGLKDKLTGEAYSRSQSTIPSIPQGQLEIKDQNPKNAPQPSTFVPGGSFYKLKNTGYSSAAAPKAPWTHSPSKQNAEKFAHATKEREKLPRYSPQPLKQSVPFRYLGQAMGVFLIAERESALYLVDQHAAHERVIYEEMCHAAPATVNLLIPLPLDLDARAKMKIELRKERLSSLGICVEKKDDSWDITGIPQAATGMEQEIAQFLEEGAGDAESLEKALWADLACKAAVKDHHVLDDDAAERLLEKTFALPTPRCPHGRPLWFAINREELFELVGRTV